MIVNNGLDIHVNENKLEYIRKKYNNFGESKTKWLIDCRVHDELGFPLFNHSYSVKERLSWLCNWGLSRLSRSKRNHNHWFGVKHDRKRVAQRKGNKKDCLHRERADKCSSILRE